jgi:hypothetical protein
VGVPGFNKSCKETYSVNRSRKQSFNVHCLIVLLKTFLYGGLAYFEILLKCLTAVVTAGYITDKKVVAVETDIKHV